MYYRLKEPYAFRGWKKLPYAICALKGPKMFERPFFFGKEIFLDMLYFNGQENVDPDSFSGGTKGVSCWKDYACEVIYMHDSTSTSHACFGDYLCDVIYHDGAFSVLASLFY